MMVGVLLLPHVAVAQWGRGRMMGWGRVRSAGAGTATKGARHRRRRLSVGRLWGSPAGYPPSAYGGGYPAPGYPAQAYPPQQYAPAGYPPPAYQQPYAYPPPGQGPQQASAKQMQCQEWATTQSGYNPNAPSHDRDGNAVLHGREGRRCSRRRAGGGGRGGRRRRSRGNTSQGAEEGAAMGGHDGRVQAPGPEQAEIAAADPAGAAAEPAERRIQPSPGSVSDRARLHRPLEERPMSTWKWWAGVGSWSGWAWSRRERPGRRSMDGSTPILCAMIAATECDRWGACDPVDPGAAGLPPFVRVNVGAEGPRGH